MDTKEILARLSASYVLLKGADDDRRWPKNQGSLDAIVGHADDSPNGPNDGDDDDSGDGDAGEDS